MQAIIIQFWYVLKQILKTILPGGLQSVVNMASNVAGKPLHEKIKDFYLEHGWEWQPVNVGGIRDTANPNTYNDYIYICTDQGVRIWRGTTEPGRGWTVDKMNKYGVSWTAVIPLGNYKNFYKIGSMAKAGKCLRMIGRVKLYDVRKKELRLGGGCHMHRRFSSGEFVGVSSAGCQVPAEEKAMDQILAELDQAPIEHFDYSISDIKEFPSIAGHKVG